MPTGVFACVAVFENIFNTRIDLPKATRNPVYICGSKFGYAVKHAFEWAPTKRTGRGFLPL